MRIIDCITHQLSGVAVLQECGIDQQGLYQSGKIPPPVLLIVPRGTAEAKINTIRVSLSQATAKAGTPRTFEIHVNCVIESVMIKGDEQTPVDYMALHFQSGTQKNRFAAAFFRTINKRG